MVLVKSGNMKCGPSNEYHMAYASATFITSPATSPSLTD